MDLLLEMIAWFAQMGASSTSLSKMYEPKIPEKLVKKDKNNI